MDIQKITTAVTNANIVTESLKSEVENIIPQLQQYIGKQITTQKGKSAKFIYTHLDHEPQGNCFIDCSTSSLWLHVNLRAGRKEIWIGRIKDCVLVEVATVEDTIKTFNLDHVATVDECIRMMKDYKLAKGIIEDIKNRFPLDTDFLKYI